MGDDNVETTALCIMGMSGFLLLALWSDKKKKKIEKNQRRTLVTLITKDLLLAGLYFCQVTDTYLTP